MTIRFIAMTTETARALRSGGPDAYGNAPERAVSDGLGVPCRHCLRIVPAGAEYLIVAHRPFGALQPYAETGPVFLCAGACERGGGAALPAILDSPDYIVRGYGANERIVYGTGGVTARGAIAEQAGTLLSRPDVAFVHVRSSRNNCYQCRIERADQARTSAS